MRNRKIRVMLVEDEAIIRKYLALICANMDCNVVAETGFGEEVLALFKEAKPDVIFMDIKLKGTMSGIDAALQISKETDTPIVFISAYDYEEPVRQLQIKNTVAFIPKPAEPENIEPIMEKLRHHCRVS